LAWTVVAWSWRWWRRRRWWRSWTVVLSWSWSRRRRVVCRAAVVASTVAIPPILSITLPELVG
jgi:hypothetical protein